MSVVDVRRVSKSFGGNRVVDEVSFEVGAGEIFGLVGPNGAGKTTTIRMLMDIIKPDAGELRLFGEHLGEETKNRVGYLPEERGLYKKLTVMEVLTYLASLKDVPPGRAKSRAAELLQRTNMLPHQSKKIEELSRGMGQLIQFIATIIHDPDLVILDEPFSGLDPVNIFLLKEMIAELRGQGKSIILSTHLMNEVEELCDRILMINKGQAVLYGSLKEIKSQYRQNSIFVECDHLPEGLPGVLDVKDHGKHFELFLEGETSPREVLNALLSQGVQVDRFEVSTPSLAEIFVRVVKEGR